jgi:excisionase family DNA binding protein
MEELLTIAEVAEIVKVRPETIRRYVKTRKLKALTLPGGDYRIRRCDLDVLLTPHTASPFNAATIYADELLQGGLNRQK